MKKSLSIFLIAAVVLVSGLTFSAHARPLGDTVPTATPDPPSRLSGVTDIQRAAPADFRIMDVSPQAVCTNLITDPGFEGGIPNPSWYEYSYLYGTPLCSTSGTYACNLTVGPRTGAYWAWFGGAGPGFDELSVISQTVTILTDTATLSFYLRVEPGPGGADDFLQIFIDNTEVFTTTALTASAYTGSYKQVSINASPFANGAAHSIVFWSETYDQTVNFHVDDVGLCAFAATSKVYLPSARR